MSVFHDEVEIEDFEFDEETEMYYFPCPCGDRFCISKVGTELTVLTELTADSSSVVEDRKLFKALFYLHFVFYTFLQSLFYSPTLKSFYLYFSAIKKKES